MSVHLFLDCEGSSQQDRVAVPSSGVNFITQSVKSVRGVRASAGVEQVSPQIATKFCMRHLDQYTAVVQEC